MAIPNHLPDTEVVLLEIEILLTVVSIGAWGGFVGFFLRKSKAQVNDSHRNIVNCLIQMIISCFSSFLLSAFAIEHGASFNMVLLAAGLGGVFAAPILKLLGEKVKKYLGSENFK